MSVLGNAVSARASTSSKVSAVVAVLAVTTGFLLLVGLASKGLHLALGIHVPVSLRGRTLLLIGGSALGEVFALAGLLSYLRSRGESLTDLGLRRRAAPAGWALALTGTALYVWMVFAGAVHGMPFKEISVFRIAGALLAALSAGPIEEIFFRGFVMERLRGAGFGTAVQVLASAGLFGFAHAGWGLLSGRPQWGALTGTMVFTGLLGLVYAIAYVLSRRGLQAVISAHFLMDVLIEPWLVLTALTAATVHAR